MEFAKKIHFDHDIELLQDKINTKKKKKKSVVINNEKQLPTIIVTFIEDLELKNKRIKEHKKYIQYFYMYIQQKYNFENKSDLIEQNFYQKKYVESFEDFIRHRIVRQEISKASGYRYLLTVKHFVAFLKTNKYIFFSYNIPSNLIDSGKEANEYVSQEDFCILIGTIYNTHSRLMYRDLSIVLLLFETGCRPIEISNIRLRDINYTECVVTIISKKSGKRMMKVNQSLIKVLKRYLSERDLIASISSKEEPLFVNRYGKQLQSDNITSFLWKYNIRAFGESKFSPKSLRHTFVTNALENNNDFTEVSHSMGHKHRISTMRYLDKSVQRLLRNSKCYNPLTRIMEED